MGRRALGTALFTALFLLAPAALGAQVAIGGGAGLVFSTLGGDGIDDEDADTRTGFYAGASLGIPLSGIIGLSTGAYYVQKGADSAGGEGAIELAYLEFPALLQVSVTGPERPVGVSLYGGPSFGFNLSCDDTATGGDSDCSDDVESFDLGALFGAGLSFQAGETAVVSVIGGLNLGLTSIATDDEDDVKNEAYFLGVGVSWPMGG